MGCVVGCGRCRPRPRDFCLPSLHQRADPQPEPTSPGGTATRIHPPIEPAKRGEGPTVWAKAQIPIRGRITLQDWPSPGAWPGSTSGINHLQGPGASHAPLPPALGSRLSHHPIVSGARPAAADKALSLG